MAEGKSEVGVNAVITVDYTKRRGKRKSGQQFLALNIWRNLRILRDG